MEKKRGAKYCDNGPRCYYNHGKAEAGPSTDRCAFPARPCMSWL
jgi:hypothetical protein